MNWLDEFLKHPVLLTLIIIMSPLAIITTELRRIFSDPVKELNKTMRTQAGLSNFNRALIYLSDYVVFASELDRVSITEH